MRVKIGPYINRWSAHRFHQWFLDKHHQKPYWAVNENEHTRIDRFVEYVCDKWQIVLNATINQITDRMERSIKVRIDKYDVWSMDHTLALIIHPMLLKLKEQKQGVPGVEDDDVPHHMRSTVEGCEDPFLQARWDYILDEMIWTFETLADPDFENQFYSGGEVRIDDNNILQIGEKFKVNQTDMDAAIARQTNGLRLFAKYFRNLWA